MLTDDVRGLASRIAEHLATESKCLFRDVPPADKETLLGVGLVLALMRQRATAESDPVFSFSELDNLVGNAFAQPELEKLNRALFREGFVHISRVFRLVTVYPDGVILEDNIFNMLGR
ncbi:hypothetical protein HCI50_00010 [Escherichia coli]|nr:hypothetical protein [Escherichia coli]